MTSESRLLPMASPEAGPPPIFERIAIVGLGQIGGSLALACRKRWPSALVIGVDRNAVLERAVTRHAIDVASDDLVIVSEADLVVLAAPVRQNLALVARLGDCVAREAVVTDVGGTKREMVEAARVLPSRLPFVGGHPLAGSAGGGIEAARADLFEGRPWLFTPAAPGAGDVLVRLQAFVEGVGATPRVLASAADHDRLAAFLAHLPQVTATALMEVIGAHLGEEELAIAGRGLLDTTRLAASPPEVSQDVCATSADEVGLAIDELVIRLQELRGALSGGDTLARIFESAARRRRTLGS